MFITLVIAFVLFHYGCVLSHPSHYTAEDMDPVYLDNYFYDNSIDNAVADAAPDVYMKPLKMPNVRPTQKDTYLCRAYEFDPSVSEYIVGFEPHSNMQVAHHILLYGCKDPRFKPGDVWACGEMSGGSSQNWTRGETCAVGPQIIYAWARDAPELNLPKDVGFKVGGEGDIKYVVLQVHYANVDMFINGKTDESGITLKITQQRMPKLAGVYLLGTGGSVAPGSVHMETSCTVWQPSLIMHPFAYRTHTHQHGKAVSGYVIKEGWKWYEIGKHDPLKPQMFYPVMNQTLTIKHGDRLAARCTMQNNDGHTVYIGSTHKDEMCNFYIMYWAEHQELSAKKNCFSYGPPMTSWLIQGLKNMPEDASNL